MGDKKSAKNVSAQTLTSDSDCDSFYGYLKKYNPKGRGQTRFCIIHNGTFFYYKNAESARPSGYFPLEGYQASVVENAPHSHMFKVEHKKKESTRSYSFSGVSEKDLTSWIDYINKHVVKFFPVSLYSEEDQKSEYYDYVPEGVMNTLSQDYFRQKVAEKEGHRYVESTDQEDITPAVPARTQQMDREYKDYLSVDNRYHSTMPGSDCNENIQNQDNVMTSEYVSMGQSGQMSDNYCSMVSINESTSMPMKKNSMMDEYIRMTNEMSDENIYQGKNIAEESPYVAVIDVYDGESDGDSSEGEYPTTVDAIKKVHGKKSHKTSKTLPHASTVDTGYIEMDDIYNELKSVTKGTTGKMNRSATLPSPTETSIPTKGQRSATLPPFSSFNDSRAAYPPPIPGRMSVNPVETPIIENLEDHVILPKSCIHANIQKDQCLHFLSAFDVGTYLIRTAREDGKDALAILARKTLPKVKHFIVFESNDGKRYLHKEAPKFDTLHELIRHYYFNMLPQTELKLISPLSNLQNSDEDNYVI